MKLGEYLQYDAVGLAECVARGEISAGELLDLALRQSAAAQPKTNAICRLMEDEARSQLKKKPLAGPFAGVPFLIRDCAEGDQRWIIDAPPPEVEPLALPGALNSPAL